MGRGFSRDIKVRVIIAALAAEVLVCFFPQPLHLKIEEGIDEEL